MAEWIKATFDEKNQLYERVFVPPSSETERETQFVVNFASITSNSRIIDVCCGTGRHILSLAKKGFSVDGIDISPVSITEAVKAANLLQSELLQPNFYIDDVRKLPQNHPELIGRYALAINLFSSFGYYENDEEQLALLKGINQVLQHGGALLLDVPNKDYILQHFSAKSEFAVGNLTAKVLRRFDSEKSRIETKTIVLDNQTEVTLEVAMNIYSYEEITKLLQRAGFTIEKVVSDFDAEEFNPLSPNCKRMIILARKT